MRAAAWPEVTRNPRPYDPGQRESGKLSPDGRAKVANVFFLTIQLIAEGVHLIAIGMNQLDIFSSRVGLVVNYY